MAIAKSSVKAITDAKTPVECFGLVLDALVADATISKDVAGIVKLALDNAKADLNPAIAANLSF
jgi:hypothetical protein